MAARHLHRDYNTAWCGKDASHILMTYEADEASCKACASAKTRADKQAEKDRAAAEAEAKKVAPRTATPKSGAAPLAHPKRLGLPGA
jgi:hypothetical protein